MTHPALTKAQEIYDLARDLEPNEEVFLTAVHRITRYSARTKGEAVTAWGDGSQAYCATVYLADRKQTADLTAALEAYELSLEYQDEIEEIGLSMVEHLQAAER